MWDAWQVAVELARDVALEHADDLAFGAALGGPAGDVGAGARVTHHGDHDDPPEGLVGAPIPSAVEPFAGGEPGGGVDGGNAAEMGEGGLAAQALRVVAGGHEQRTGGVGADPTGRDQIRRGGGDQGLEHGLEPLALRVQAPHPAGQFAEGELGSADHGGGVSGTEPGRAVDQLRHGAAEQGADGAGAGLHRIEATVGPGSGVRSLNHPVPPAFRESVRVGEQNLYVQAKELVGDRDPRHHEFSIQLRALDADRSGTGLGLPVLVAFAGALLERNTRGGTIVVGPLSLGGAVELLPNPVSIAELAVDKQAATLLMPVAARRALSDLPDELWTKLNIEFYADTADCVFKSLVE